jgi:transposase
MRERALRMHAETRPSHPTMRSAVRRVAGLLGMSPGTLGRGSAGIRSTRG